MGHKNKVCLKMQAKAKFDSIQCFGRSKHEDKLAAAEAWEKSDKSISKRDYINGEIRDKIYSVSTYETYAKHNSYFIKWVEDNKPKGEIKTLEDIKRFVPEWLESRIDAGLSAYTIATEAAGLAKLYGCDYRDFCVDLPSRNREDIFRSREWGCKKRIFFRRKKRRNCEFLSGYRFAACRIGKIDA